MVNVNCQLCLDITQKTDFSSWKDCAPVHNAIYHIIYIKAG